MDDAELFKQAETPFDLGQQSPADLQRMAADDAARAEAERVAQQRAEADAQVDAFVLAGSDRTIDQLEARGQGNLFDSPASAEDADLFRQAKILMARDPDAPVPDLRLDDDGTIIGTTRPAREVFEELDAEGRAIDDLITCITGSA